MRYRPTGSPVIYAPRRTKTIAIVVPDIENPFFVSVTRGLEEVAFREGYTAWCVTPTTTLVARASTSKCWPTRPWPESSSARPTSARFGPVLKVMEQGVAIVGLDRRLENAPVDGVLSDNFGGTRTAVSYLIEQGHRRIGLIAGPAKYAPPASGAWATSRRYWTTAWPWTRN